MPRQRAPLPTASPSDWVDLVAAFAAGGELSHGVSTVSMSWSSSRWVVSRSFPTLKGSFAISLTGDTMCPAQTRVPELAAMDVGTFYLVVHEIVLHTQLVM